MAAPVPLVRLRSKQPWPVQKGCQKTCRRKKRASARAAAVREGVVPRACKPFALFVKKHVAAQKGAGRDVWRQEMKRLGHLWKSLPQQDKEKYQIKSGAEFANQRAVMQQHGLTCRKAQTAAAVEVKPRTEATNEQCQPQPLLIGQYKVVTGGLDSSGCQKLGEGSHGSVFLCLDQFHRCCAVKVFKRSDVLADVKHEASILNRLQTELGQDLTGFFPRLWHVEPQASPYPFLVMESFGSNLRALLQKHGAFCLDDCRAIGVQLKTAVCALHRLKLVHLDLKPNNAL